METTNSDATNGAQTNRKRFTPEQRQRLLTRLRQSQLSQREFAAREQIGLSTLNRWVHQAKQIAIEPGPMRFQELPLPSLGRAWAAEVVSPQNWTLRLAQVPEPLGLQRLVQALPC